jgi:NitT/TauT family transport system ATP-binding protein
VYLSDRIGVMNTRPGRLNNVVDVDLPRPRLPSLRSEADYYDVVRTVRGLIGPMHEATDAPAGTA